MRYLDRMQPLALVALRLTLGIIFFVPESPIRTPGRVDLRGALLLAAWLVALLVPVSEGPTWGWTSARTIGLLVVAGALLVVWVRVEWRTKAPLVAGGVALSPVKPGWAKFPFPGESAKS